MSKLIKEAITEYFGPQCSGYDEDCVCCNVWKEYEALTAAAPHMSGSAREQEAKDYEAIGQAYMNAFDVLTSEDTEWKDYTPAECPTEFLMDVFWAQQEQKSAREQALEEAAWLVENHAYTDSPEGKSLKPSVYAKSDQHHATIAAAIRTLKSQPAQTGGGE